MSVTETSLIGLKKLRLRFADSNRPGNESILFTDAGLFDRVRKRPVDARAFMHLKAKADVLPIVPSLFKLV